MLHTKTAKAFSLTASHATATHIVDLPKSVVLAIMLSELYQILNGTERLAT